MPTSSPLSAELRAFAETPDRYTLLSDDVARFADERVCVIHGATWAAVGGIDVAEGDVAALLDEVRERVGPGKRVTWWVGPSARPSNLLDRLRALGLCDPEDGHLVVHALACIAAPVAAPEKVDVCRIESVDEFGTFAEIGWDAFGFDEERRATERLHVAETFAAAERAGTPVTFGAYLDGRPAGLGRSIYADRGVFLVGGSVATWARGRGVYRALVRARWDDAAARGTPALVTEALPDTSYPILKRLGFVDVCVTRRLEDASA